MPTPKKLKPAEFAAHAVTVALARGLTATALTAFLDAHTLWRGLRAELEIYAEAEAAALAALAPDALLVALLPPETVAALTPAKRKDLRGRIRAEAEGRGRATAALLRLINTQVAASEAAGPSFRAAAAARLEEYLQPVPAPETT